MWVLREVPALIENTLMMRWNDVVYRYSVRLRCTVYSYLENTRLWYNLLVMSSGTILMG